GGGGRGGWGARARVRAALGPGDAGVAIRWLAAGGGEGQGLGGPLIGPPAAKTSAPPSSPSQPGEPADTRRGGLQPHGSERRIGRTTLGSALPRSARRPALPVSFAVFRLAGRRR